MGKAKSWTDVAPAEVAVGGVAGDTILVQERSLDNLRRPNAAVTRLCESCCCHMVMAVLQRWRTARGPPPSKTAWL